MRNRRKARRIIALTTVVLAALVLRAAYRRIADPERVRRYAQAYLQEQFNGQVTVGSAGFSWLEGILLQDVTIARSENSPAAGGDAEYPVFSCRRVDLVPRFRSLLRGELKIASLTALEPTCTVVREAQGTTNLTGLLRADVLRRGESLVLPRIELRDTSLQVIHREGEVSRQVENLKLTVRGRMSERNANTYDLVWHRDGAQEANGHSQIDLRTYRIRNVYGGLPWMSLEGVMIALNATYNQAGTWSDLLGLEGAVRASDYNFASVFDGDDQRSATIELDGASLSIPIDQHETTCTREERYLRFERVHGAIELTAQGIRANFEGLFHGSKCRASATMRGGTQRIATLDDVGLEARLWLEGLEFPQPGPDGSGPQTRFINHWPKLARFFQDYDPHGRVDVEVDAVKLAGTDEPVTLRRWMVSARGGDASYRLFPYRVSHLTGTVESAAEGIKLQRISGIHEGGTVTVDGSIAGSTPGAAAVLWITGRGLPIDTALCESIQREYLAVCDRYEPMGSVNVDIELTRPSCAGGQPVPWRSVTAVSFDDLSLRYVGLPYTLEGLSGTLAGERNTWRFADVHGRAGDASVQLDGNISVESDQTANFAVEVMATDMALDDRLLQSLPAAMRNRVMPYQPNGCVDIHAFLAREGLAPLQHRSEITLKGVTIGNDDSTMIEDIRGRMQIAGDRIVLHDLVGRHGQGTLGLSGSLDGSFEHPQLELVARCRDVRLDDSLLRFAPPRLREVLTGWSVDGLVNADVTVETDRIRPAEPSAISGVAVLDGATIRHLQFRLPFEGVRGVIRFNESGGQADGLSGHVGPVRITADFLVRLDAGGEEGTFAITALQTSLESLQGILPEGMRAAWDRWSPTGLVDLHLDRLQYKRDNAGQPHTWTVNGGATLHGVSTAAPGDIRGAQGAVSISGTLLDHLGGCALSGELQLSEVDVYGRRLTGVSAPWAFVQTVDGKRQVTLDPLHAQAWDGLLTARATATFAPEQTDYDLTATVHRMDLYSFLNAPSTVGITAHEPVDAQGRVDIRVDLSGIAGDPYSRRGRGRIEISEGQMYRLPLMLAILNVINLSIPQEDAFADAEADFMMMGNRVEFKDILLRGPALALVGAGSMSWPDMGLNLDLVNVSPKGWIRLSALSDFLERASGELMGLKVTGPPSRPSVQAKPVPGVTEELRRLFQKKKTRRLQAAAS